MRSPEKRKMAKYTPKWFRAQKRALIEHAKAIDDFKSAASNFRKLVTLGPDSDADLQAALHGMGVISYARPFVVDGRTFKKRLISGQPGFRNDVHDQLLELRNKLVAHSDAEFARGRLFVRMATFNVDSGCVNLPIGAEVMIRNLHTVGNFELAEACLAHSEAALQGSADTILLDLKEYALASAQYPDAYAASGARPANLGIVANETKFSLPSPGSEVTIPDVLLNPGQLLPPPPLKLGSDGYLYRELAVKVELRGKGSVTMPDGSNFEFGLSHGKAGGPESNEAP
jgi:hypothetical protein